MPLYWRRLAAVLVIAILAAYLPVPVHAQTGVEGQRIYVLGAVNKPGDYEFKQGMDAEQAIDLAGGLTADADPNGLVLIRNSGDKVVLDTQAILEGRTKIEVAGGDTIIAKPKSLTTSTAVTPTTPAVTAKTPIETVATFHASIIGEVNRPGVYSLKNGATDNLAALIEEAGGVTPKADLRRVSISGVRGSERLTATLDASSDATRQATIIQPDDTVFVPQTESKPRKHKISLNDVYLGTVILYTLVRIFRND